MSISHATAEWEGTLKEGSGGMKPAHGASVPFALSTRFEGAEGSNPEELIGAALAGCFSMALAAALGKEGLHPRTIHTEAHVALEKKDAGFEITGIALRTKADVPDLERETFDRIALETKSTCPVSKALQAVPISLDAHLERS